MRFVFVLAGHLGKTAAEVCEQVDARELLYWLAYHSIDPIGEQRSDLRNAMLLQAMASLSGSKAKVADFMPFDPGRAERPSNARRTFEAMLAIARKAKQRG